MTAQPPKAPQFFFLTEGAERRSVQRSDPTQAAPYPADPPPDADAIRADWQPPCPLLILDSSPDGSTQGIWVKVEEDATTCTPTAATPRERPILVAGG